MANTLTTYYSLTKPQPQGDQNQWGIHLNTDLDALDSLLNQIAGGFNPGLNSPSSSASNITLSNPLQNFQNLSFSAGGLSVILPPMNVPNQASGSIRAGTTLSLYNSGSFPYDILAQDGSTVVFNGVLPNQIAYLTLLSNGTANGTFVAGFLPRARLSLGGNITLYVSPTGSDSNDGLTTSTPFLTRQKAVNTIANNYDLNGFTATIQMLNGTYTDAVTILQPWVGGGIANVILTGNSGSPSSTIDHGGLTVTGLGSAITVQDYQTGTSSAALMAFNGGTISTGPGMIYGANANFHMVIEYGSIYVNNNFTINGAGVYHVSNFGGRLSWANGLTVTLSGTPAFSGQFMSIRNLALAIVAGATFSGSATGTRYGVTINAVLNTGGGGANYLPGNAAGSVSSGGLYE